jgi:hypothetical protein
VIVVVLVIVRNAKEASRLVRHARKDSGDIPGAARALGVPVTVHHVAVQRAADAVGGDRGRCPACRTTGDVDLRTLDWHRGAAVTALTPALSCRSCRPNAPFAELVCLSKSNVAEEYYAERSGNRWVTE